MNAKRPAPRRWLFWAAVGGAFALAYGQAPLYTSNQNQYFLHGMASAGYGHLSQDWLANTQDPTPVFSALVQASFAWLGAWSFYLEYAILVALTLWSLYAVAGWLVPDLTRPAHRLILLVALTMLYSEAARFVLSRLPWSDAGDLFEGGVAGQRLLGQVFQPSVFGALLVTSVALFVRGRPHWAALLAAGAATLHPTYLLTAGSLVVAYMGVLAIGDHRPRTALTCGGLALVGVGPIMAHTLAVFGPGTSQVSADAAKVLVEFRLPHHALLAQWLDPSVAIKLGVILGAMLVVRRTRLFPILVAPAGVGLVVTLVQVATGNNRLALLFPWRVSVLLVPLSTAVIVAVGLARGVDLLDHRGVRH
jgi:uncharacterized membrane protein